jgi:hypothetical protein
VFSVEAAEMLLVAVVAVVVDTEVVVDSQAVLATVVDTAVAGPTEYSAVEVEMAAMAAGPIGVARQMETATVVDTETFEIPF